MPSSPPLGTLEHTLGTATGKVPRDSASRHKQQRQGPWELPLRTRQTGQCKHRKKLLLDFERISRKCILSTGFNFK